MKLKPEEAISAAVNDMVKLWQNQRRFNGVAFHVPNEFQAVKNGAAAWAKKKRIGCAAGAPDWVFLWDGRGAVVELKAGKNDIKGLKGDQLNMQELCRWYNIPHAVCRCIEDVEVFLKDIGALT